MENEKLNCDVFNSVKFLFAKPSHQGHYVYAIDDVKNLQIIDKDSLRNLLIKLKCGDFIKINYLLDRNFPFFYYTKTKELLEFQETNSEITKKDLTNFIHEELSIKSNIENQKSPYEIFFGKESDFYKQNFYDMENSLWQSSMNTR